MKESETAEVGLRRPLANARGSVGFAEPRPLGSGLPEPTLRLGAIAVFALAGALFAAGRADKAEYVGGTVSDLARGKGTVDLTSERQFAFRSDKGELKIPYGRVNLLEYGQQVDRRIGMAVVISPLFLLSKKRRHFLTIGYTDETGNQHAAVFRVDKRSVRSVLAGLEARTGRKIEYQDTEARKAGKG